MLDQFSRNMLALDMQLAQSRTVDDLHRRSLARAVKTFRFASQHADGGGLVASRERATRVVDSSAQFSSRRQPGWCSQLTIELDNRFSFGIDVN